MAYRAFGMGEHVHPLSMWQSSLCQGAEQGGDGVHKGEEQGQVGRRELTPAHVYTLGILVEMALEVRRFEVGRAWVKGVGSAVSRLS
eukprot:364522-Chlamydomonas_euryale.AAC.6